jgi:hypothetical protein
MVMVMYDATVAVAVGDLLFFEKCQLIRVNGRTAHGDECKYLSFSCFSVYKNFHLAPNNCLSLLSEQRANQQWLVY